MLDRLLILGTLLGSLSPLLAFVQLFQLKEWRLDRLREHLRRDGWIATYLRILFRGAIGKQRVPVWTKKALLITLTAIAFTAALTFALPRGAATTLVLALLIIALQPLSVLLAWLAWKPIDLFLKRRLLARASAHRATFVDATVVGIVGSVGKTTTKELLACLLEDMHPIVTPQHVNTELGVAAWLLTAVPRGAKQPFLIVEMGAYAKGEIATLCRVAQPTIAVVTALGSDHLALFGSEDAIVDANAEILDALPAHGKVFLYGANEQASGLARRTHLPTVTVGPADIHDIRETDRGLAFDMFNTRFNVALHGRHNANNAALGLSVARDAGIPPERLRELLARFRGAPNTFKLRTERGVMILDDTYNVSPLSFRAALEWAKLRPERPRVLLTSGLLETGAEEAHFLQELGTLASTCVERVIFTTDAGKDAFETAFDSPVESLAQAKPVTDDALLVCVGRMPTTIIQRLLP